MAGEFFIVTFGPDGEPGLPEDLIPITVIERHFRPFMTRCRVTDDTDHEALLVYPVLTRDRSGEWIPDTSSRGRAVNETEMLFVESAPGSGLIANISFWHHPEHHAFEAGLYAVLASASAAAVGPDGMCPVIGRQETLARLPPDLVASMGPPHLATSPDDLWLGPEREPKAPPTGDLAAKADADLNIQRARQAQVVNLKREQVAIMLQYHLADLSGMIDQIRMEYPGDDQVSLLEDYTGLLAAALKVCSQLEAPGWDRAARAAFDAIPRFALPSLINKGAITNRFAERLKRMDAIIASSSTRFLPDAEREQERWGDLDKQARARGLPVLTSDQPKIANLQNWSDVVLKAERKRQHQRLDGDRSSIWSEFTSSAQLVSEWLEQGAHAHADTAGSNEAAFHALLVSARKAAKDTTHADWDDAVLHAVQMLLNFGLPTRLNAQRTSGPFDLHFRDVGLRLQLSLQRRLDRMHDQSIQLERLDAEIMRRGIGVSQR